ncbi:sensor histidine kinase [Parabacteroides sp.]
MAGLEVAYNNFLISFLIDRKYRLGRHLLLVLFFVFVSFNMPLMTCATFLDRLDYMVIYTSLVLLFTYLAGIYLHIYVLLPKFLLKKRYMLYVGLVSLQIVIILSISAASDYWLNRYYHQEPGIYSYFYKSRIPAVEMIGNFLLYALLIAGTSVTVLLRHWLEYSKRKNELEKVNLKTEVDRLKDQINPEFLFNMLDEAKERTFDNPDQASMVLMKLSKLLRYQLYDGNREKVLLLSEIAFIEQFLSLAKMRYSNLSFTVSTAGNVNRMFIPPLLFVPFAIHYIRLLPLVKTPMDLHFTFNAGQQGLSFLCICFTPGAATRKEIEESRELKDVRQRLDLLFPAAYTLSVSDEGALHKIDLNIKL